MNNYFLRITILAISLVTFNFSASAKVETDDNKEKQRKAYIQTIIFSALKSNHYHVPEFDDEFSRKAYKEYLDNLDFNKQFLIQEDIDFLNKYENHIDDMILHRKVDLFYKALEKYQVRFKTVEQFYKEILAEPFDYTKEEIYETDSENKTWTNNLVELKDRWRKNLKFSTIARIYNRDTDINKKDSLGNINLPDSLSSLTEQERWVKIEKSSREAVLKNMDNYFTSLSKIKTEDQFEIYINSILGVVDPHTNYLAPKTNENFNISMSGKLEGIGARLSQIDGVIKVAEIIPGSPCHLQGELEAEDIILKAAEKDKEPTSLEDMLLSDAIRFIRGKKGTEVTLTVKKIDGSTKNIPIVRDVILTKETYAKSAIINKNNKVGYIKLPKFYVDFSDRSGRRCSTDMKKEIEKLKAEGAESLIIDLRNNGGGSLTDVVDIAGYFIEKGPIVQIKNYNGSKHVLKDKDSELVFKGRVVVLINNFSASASEILAGALKDYDRAIIMGSNHSFGKGTVQNIINFDRQIKTKFPNLGSIGSLKITTKKFYRINGETTQKKGVESDIVLPDNYMFLDMGESDREYALEWDKIKESDHNDYNLWMNSKQIKKFKANRIEKDPVFNYIENRAKELKEKREDSTIDLNYKNYKKERQEIENEKDLLNDLIEENRKKLIITNLDADLKEICTDTVRSKINDKWIKSLEKDIYINEAVEVLNN